MRFNVLIFAVAAAACATAQAQSFDQPTAADAPALTQCLATHDTYLSRQACIGLVSRACADHGGEAAETTAGLAMCARREQTAWRAIMEQSVTQLRAQESETQNLLLMQYLEKGETWAIVRCAYAASQYEGGSLARVLAAQCHRNDAGERAIELYTRLSEAELR